MIAKDTQPYISIIIPVYEGRKYFRELLQDIQKQSLQNIEIILVDDCGTDGAFEEALLIAQQDSRFVCLRNETNVGQGICRNKAMDIARGEYLAFADADDLIPQNFYETLYIKAKSGNYKVVKGNRVAVFPDGHKQYSQINTEIVNKLLAGKPLHCCFTYEHQTGLFLRSHVEAVHARNAEGRRDQDTAFLLWALYDVKPEEFAMVPEATYYYRKHDNAVTANINYTYMVELMKSFAFKLNFLLSRNDVDEHTTEMMSNAIETRFSNRLCASLLHPATQPDEKWLELIRNMRQMLSLYVEKHAMPAPKRYTQMALDSTISDEQILQVCRKSAETGYFGSFSPKQYRELTECVLKPEVHIAMALIDTTIVQGIVALSSIKRHKKSDAQYHIHLFIDRVGQQWLETLKEIDSPDFRIHILEELDIAQYRKAVSMRSYEDAVKNHLATKLPQLDRVIFCYANISVHCDLSIIYSQPIEEASMATCMAISRKGRLYNMNTGIQLLNLHRIRQNTHHIKAKELAGDLLSTLPAEEIVSWHPRYSLPLISILETHLNISQFNKLFGTTYRHIRELVSESKIFLYPPAANLISAKYANCNSYWLEELRYSPIAYTQLIAPSPISIQAPPKEKKPAAAPEKKPETEQKKIPATAKKSDKPRQPYKKEIRILNIPVWSKNDRTGKRIYRLFGIRVGSKNIR